MMSKQWILAALLTVGLIGLAASAAEAAGKEKKKQKDGAVTLSDLPPAARATLLKEVGNGRIVELLKKIKKGQVVYHADVRIGHKEGEIEVAPNGRLVRREVD